MSQRQYLIYQDIADPLRPAPAAPETITVDKWFKEHPNPILGKTLITAILAGSFFFFNPESLVANDKVPDWHPQQNQPQRLVTPLERQHTGEFRFEVPREILLTDWFQEAQQPYFSKRRDYHTGELRFELPREVFVSDWWQQPSEPVLRKPTQLLGGETRTELIEAVEDVTLDKWHRPASEPYFSKARNYFTGEFRFEVPRDILLSDWFQAASEPVRRIVQRLQGEYVRLDIIADDTQLNEWYQPASEPYFSKKRNYFTGEFRFEVPRDILLSDWWRPASEPYFPKRPQLLGGESRFELPREILITDWLADYPNQLKQPIREVNFGEYRFELPREILITDWLSSYPNQLKQPPRKTDFGEYRFEIPRDVLITDWLANYPDQLKQPIRQLLFNETRVEIITAEEVTLDKWFQRTSEPYFSKKRDYFTGEFRFEVPRDILLSDWFQAASEPVRRIVQRLQGEYARLDVIVEDTQVDEWYQPPSEPYFPKTRNYFTGEFRFEVPRGILLTDWWQQPNQPYFKRIFNGNFGETRVDIVEIISPLPTPPTPGGGYEQPADEIDILKKRINQDDEEIILIAGLWLTNKK